MTEESSIYHTPKKLQIDLWAELIIAKNIQTDEPILGTYDEHGQPQPYTVKVTALKADETIECIHDYKVKYDKANVVEDFICASKVIVTIPFQAFFWVKTNMGYNCLQINWTFKKTIELAKFIKMDGTPLNQQEFIENVDQSKVSVKNFQLEYVSILEKEECSPYEQKIQVIITATIIDKLGKYQDVIVYGRLSDE